MSGVWQCRMCRVLNQEDGTRCRSCRVRRGWHAPLHMYLLFAAVVTVGVVALALTVSGAWHPVTAP